jgi:hypothetical protein
MELKRLVRHEASDNLILVEDERILAVQRELVKYIHSTSFFLEEKSGLLAKVSLFAEQVEKDKRETAEYFQAYCLGIGTFYSVHLIHLPKDVEFKELTNPVEKQIAFDLYQYIVLG